MQNNLHPHYILSTRKQDSQFVSTLIISSPSARTKHPLHKNRPRSVYRININITQVEAVDPSSPEHPPSSFLLAAFVGSQIPNWIRGQRRDILLWAVINKENRKVGPMVARTGIERCPNTNPPLQAFHGGAGRNGCFYSRWQLLIWRVPLARRFPRERNPI